MKKYIYYEYIYRIKYFLVSDVKTFCLLDDSSVVNMKILSTDSISDSVLLD